MLNSVTLLVIILLNSVTFIKDYVKFGSFY